MRLILIGIASAIVSILVIALSKRNQKQGLVTEAGWHVLRPNWLIKVMIAGGGIFMLLPLAILTEFASSGSHADEHTMFTVALAALLSGITLYMSWCGYGRRLQWRDNELRIQTVFGPPVSRWLSDVVSVRKSDMRGEYCLTFKDGSKLWFSEHLHGADQLARKVQ